MHLLRKRNFGRHILAIPNPFKYPCSAYAVHTTCVSSSPTYSHQLLWLGRVPYYTSSPRLICLPRTEGKWYGTRAYQGSDESPLVACLFKLVVPVPACHVCYFESVRYDCSVYVLTTNATKSNQFRLALLSGPMQIWISARPFSSRYSAPVPLAARVTSPAFHFAFEHVDCLFQLFRPHPWPRCHP